MNFAVWEKAAKGRVGKGGNQTMKALVKVDKITSEADAQELAKYLSARPGISVVSVSLQRRTVSFDIDQDIVPLTDVKAEIKEKGFAS
jgi:copper chaperone CopZ